MTDFGPVMQKDIDLSKTGDQFDGKTFVFTIPAAQPALTSFLPQAVFSQRSLPIAGATRIYVSIPAGIPTLDPANADESEAEALTIDLRG